MMKTKFRAKTFFILAALLAGHFSSAHAKSSGMQDLSGLSLEDLMSIKVTSVSKKPQNLVDSAAAIFVITSKDIAHSGVTSIPEALRMVPGLHVARIDSNKWAVSSRGFNNRFTKKLLVLIDGRSVYTPSFSGVYWEAQDVLPEDVERIEVVRGPGASLWGANAVNGVINIITKHAADTRGGLATAGGGNAERAFGGVRYGASLGKGSYGRVYAKYFGRDEFEYETGGGAGDNWEAFRAGFRVDSKLSGPDNLTFQGDIYTGEINQRAVNAPYDLPPFAKVVEDDTHMSGGNLIVRWQRVLSSSSDFTFQAYYDHTNREDIYIHEKRDSFDLDFQHHFMQAKGHDMIWGARYRHTHDDFANPNILEYSSNSRGDQLFSAFIQDEITIFKDKLWLILGSKFEHNDYSGSEIQPNGRLLWSPHSGHRFWTAVSRAVRTPSRVEHDGSLNVMTLPPPSPFVPFPIKIFIKGDTSFDSEELTAYEAGYRFVPGENFSLDFAFFFNDYDNLQSYVLTEPKLMGTHLERNIFSTNDADGHVYGGEVSASFQPFKWLKTDISYGFIETDVTGMEAPKHQVSIGAGLFPAKEVDVDFWLRYVDHVEASRNSTKGFGTYNIDNYVTIDLRMAWRLTKELELCLVGQNLLDKGHMEYVQEILILPTETPRSFYGQVKYLF